MLRDKVLAWIRKSRIVASFYGSLAFFQAKFLLKRRNPYEALKCLLDARRRIPDLKQTEKHGKLIQEILQETTMEDGQFLPIEKNRLHEFFKQSKFYAAAQREFGKEPFEDRRRMRYFRKNHTVERQGMVMILKNPVPATGEKGVLIIKFTPSFEQFPATYNLPEIAKNYRIVFEPSTYRNIEPSLFLYSGRGLHHLLECVQPSDEEILRHLPSSLIKIKMVSADWMDIEMFVPVEEKKIYDTIMIASWQRLKRHHVVFDGLKALRDYKPDFRACFVGVPAEMKLDDIQNMAKKRGILQHCDFFERIPPEKVARLLATSRMAIHFSDAEGVPRSTHEAWLCDVPIIVYKHNIGFRHTWITEQTGLSCDDAELPEAIRYILEHPGQFSPRAFLLERSGNVNAHRMLNEKLKEIALENGEPWTRDIVPKKNAPSLRYVNEEDRLEMEPHYSDLEEYLLIR